MQENYAATTKPKWLEHIKYDEQDAALDSTRTPEHALAQNFLIYIGVSNRQFELKGWGEHRYLSDLLVSFKSFTTPRDT